MNTKSRVLSHRKLFSSPLFFSLDDYSFLSFTGADATSFLQALTTCDVAALSKGTIKPAAVLDNRARVLFLFYIFCQNKDHYYLWASNEEISHLKKHFERLLFSEKVSIKVHRGTIFVASGTQIHSFLSKRFIFLRELQDFSFSPLLVEKSSLVAFRLDALGECCFFFFSLVREKKCSLADFFCCEIKEQPKEKWVSMCFDAGFFLNRACYPLGVLFNQLEKERTFIAMSKGCYPGQEVVERIKTQNKMPSHSIRVLFFSQKDNDNARKTIAVGDQIFFQKQLVGEVIAFAYSCFYQSWVLSVRLTRLFLKKTLHSPCLQIKDSSFFFEKLSEIPFYQETLTQRELNNLYKEGMIFFHQAQYEKAQEIFDVAQNISGAWWQKDYTKVLEALSVVEEKMGNHQKAMATNRLFSYYAPNAVMPHANLSRLFMLAGEIEKAEKEKSLSTMKQFRQMEKSDENVSISQNNTIEKKKMFLDILAQDEKDDIALFSLGKLYFEEKNDVEAKKMLEKLVSLHEKHSQGWLFLAKVFLRLKEKDSAKKALESGIVVAKEQGDMMPLQWMEELLVKNFS